MHVGEVSILTNENKNKRGRGRHLDSRASPQVTPTHSKNSKEVKPILMMLDTTIKPIFETSKQFRCKL